jgi:hypothetical protein
MMAAQLERVRVNAFQPEGRFPVATTSHTDDLQKGCGSLPVENVYGNQFDTIRSNKAQGNEGRFKNQKQNDIRKGRKIRGKTQVLGYVPIHIVNLPLEEIKLEKQVEVRVASPIELGETRVSEGCNVNTIQRGVDEMAGDFVKYLQEKLAHLGKRDRQILEPVLRQYKHLFYGIGSRELGCTNQIEHGIETGEARPIC